MLSHSAQASKVKDGRLKKKKLRHSLQIGRPEDHCPRRSRGKKNFYRNRRVETYLKMSDHSKPSRRIIASAHCYDTNLLISPSVQKTLSSSNWKSDQVSK